ncbi:intraflagellar transport protein 46 homolog isoform X2 [Apostichopus japonicus]|uniref:intraflagellar transport protein 46 homolog isoform X2 n=1 Tax=Stichopus japonicus TaxID=307972 RepID=UPI003AB360CE
MADDSEGETSQTKLVTNQPYDESLDVPDAEEVASVYTPSPRLPPTQGSDRHPAGNQRGNDSQDSMTDRSDDDLETGVMENKPIMKPSQPVKPRQNIQSLDDDDDDDEDEEEDDEDDDDEDGSDSSDDDDDDDNQGRGVEGAYDPAEYENLPVSSEIKELFQYITRYTPQTIELEYKLKPFIPDYIPAVGDIDAFIKINRPDGQGDSLGLTVLDEPCAKQSDPTVLDLQLRAISKQTTSKAMQVRSIENASKQPKLINNWVESISELHRSKPPPTVHYTKTMPDIDTLMQEWPGEFEDLLNKIGIPSADIDCTLDQYVEMICAVLDIPIYQSKIQALHVLFTLYSEFKNSQYFKTLAEENKLDNKLKLGSEGETGEGSAVGGQEDEENSVVF